MKIEFSTFGFISNSYLKWNLLIYNGMKRHELREE